MLLDSETWSLYLMGNIKNLFHNFGKIAALVVAKVLVAGNCQTAWALKSVVFQELGIILSVLWTILFWVRSS